VPLYIPWFSYNCLQRNKPVAHGCSMMRWRLDNQDGFADSMQECGGSKTLMWSIDSVWTWRGRVYSVSVVRFPKNGMSPCSIFHS
jgi:hypothetical protein